MRQRSAKRFKPRGPKPVPLEVVFWDHVRKGADDECWLWEGSKTKFGYGLLKSRQKKYNAHRVAYELHNGAIPAGACVCHSCDNPSCCNPTHLWLGSHGDNVRDMVAKGRHGANGLRGEAIGTAKLTADQVLAIRVDPRPSTWIARDYQLASSVVRAIKRGTAWPHVPMPPNMPQAKVGRPKQIEVETFLKATERAA